MPFRSEESTPNGSIPGNRKTPGYYPLGEVEREQKLLEARKAIGQRVIGQDAVVAAVIDVLYAAKIGISLARSSRSSSRPRGVFRLVQLASARRTELAKSLAELLFNDEIAYARFDMSEYQQEHAAERLAGAPPGFVGFEQGGQLTERVRKQPFSVILFDEIEKAHSKVLQVSTSARGRKIN